MRRMALFLYLQLILLCWICVTSAQSLTGSSNPGRIACLRHGTFEQPQKGYALVNHVVATHSVTCPLDCTLECLRDARCQSFNLANAGHTCELSDQSKGTTPNDFGPKEGFTYYGPTTETGGTRPGCASVTCQNGGTCVDSCGNSQMFICECRKDYTGVYCENHSGVKSCQELKVSGANQDGIYKINPDGQGVISVYCDQTTDGGGWTVVQRRTRPYTESFERGWEKYRIGFGELTGEFWLGNDDLHRITSSGGILRVELHKTNDQKGYAKYGGFKVAGETEKYQWDMSSYGGNVGNGIYGNSESKLNIRGMNFGTPDRDNDKCWGCKCFAHAGWWANNCAMVNLNSRDGPYWKPWATADLLKFSEMKVRHNL